MYSLISLRVIWCHQTLYYICPGSMNVFQGGPQVIKSSLKWIFEQNSLKVFVMYHIHKNMRSPWTWPFTFSHQHRFSSSLSPNEASYRIWLVYKNGANKQPENLHLGFSAPKEKYTLNIRPTCLSVWSLLAEYVCQVKVKTCQIVQKRKVIRTN